MFGNVADLILGEDERLVCVCREDFVDVGGAADAGYGAGADAVRIDVY